MAVASQFMCESVLPPLINQLQKIDELSHAMNLGLILLFFTLSLSFFFVLFRLLDKDFSFFGFHIKKNINVKN
jgi:hypothetical protein